MRFVGDQRESSTGTLEVAWSIDALQDLDRPRQW